MTVQNLIGSLVSQMSANNLSYSFFCGNESDLNIIADDIPLPVVFLSEPMKYNSSISISGHYSMKAICIALILFKDSYENTQEQKSELFLKSRIALREFHLLLENSQHVKNLTLEVCAEIQYVKNALLSGVYVPFSFEMKNTDSVCL